MGSRCSRITSQSNHCGCAVLPPLLLLLLGGARLVVAPRSAPLPPLPPQVVLLEQSAPLAGDASATQASRGRRCEKAREC